LLMAHGECAVFCCKGDAVVYLVTAPEGFCCDVGVVSYDLYLGAGAPD